MVEIETGIRIPGCRRFVFKNRKYLHLSCALSYNLYNVKCTKVLPMYSLGMIPNVLIQSLSVPKATGVQNVNTVPNVPKMTNNDPNVPKTT